MNDALISDCGLYRYSLSRSWNGYDPVCAFVMLNPSTADAEQDDPTIRRCIRFAKEWGYGGLVVVNLFAYRATKPKVLKHVDDPVGPENGQMLQSVARDCRRVVVAWGAGCRWDSRASQDRLALASMRLCREDEEEILCLRKTKAGFPGHPLYVKADTVPLSYGEAPS